MRDRNYLQLLAREYKNEKSVVSEIINLRAIQGLPKGTEYFFSDLHGEHAAFLHFLKSCSGVIRDKIRDTFGHILSAKEELELANLIYYPEKYIQKAKEEGRYCDEWQSLSIYRLVRVLKRGSSKYTRSKVRKKMPPEFVYILDELLHVDEREENKQVYYSEIVHSIISIGVGDRFIVAISEVIQKLAIDHLHIIGDIFDRGPHADIIMEELMQFKDIDFQWGNHDVEWMGAAAGNPACICSVLRVGMGYNHFDVLEDGYGINLRPLSMFAAEVYREDPCHRFAPRVLDENEYDQVSPALAAKMHKAIAIILFKLEGETIKRHPEYKMEGRLLLDKIDFASSTVQIEESSYPMLDTNFPTVDPADPYRLSPGEEELLRSLIYSFKHSIRLHRHIRFLYAKGSLYRKHNSNLLFHGCIPMTESGDFDSMRFEGREYAGRSLMDYLDVKIQQAYFLPETDEKKQDALDLMYYLWCGAKSPIFGKDAMKTFENYFVEDAGCRKERVNPYYRLSEKEEYCDKIFMEFGLPIEGSHIVNGHIPVKIRDGESPIKAGGKLYLIDGGLSKAYHKKTGIGGYTLIFNSRNYALAQHMPYNKEEEGTPEIIITETLEKRVRVADTDVGRDIEQRIEDLTALRQAFLDGLIKEEI